MCIIGLYSKLLLADEAIVVGALMVAVCRPRPLRRTTRLLFCRCRRRHAVVAETEAAAFLPLASRNQLPSMCVWVCICLRVTS